MMVSTKKELDIFLSKLHKVESPKIHLEQYTTPSHIVSKILLWAHSYGDLLNKSICDLGCGSGVFAIGSAFLGAKKVTAVEKDPESIQIAKKNAEKSNVDIEFILSDVSSIFGEYDTVFQNPPFGTRIKHHDSLFLEKSLTISKVTYSIHKSSKDVRDFIKRYVENLHCTITNIVSMDFEIPRTYEFHKKKKYNVKIDVYRIVR